MKKFKELILAVDFDGMLVTDSWPDIGEPDENMFRLLKKARKEGHRLILWTCRTGEALVRALSFCAEKGLIFDAVNSNLPDKIAEYGGDSRKIHADVYLDDKAFNNNCNSCRLIMDEMLHIMFKGEENES